jgi:diacylglycerol O-acyltransferase / wax synthase
MDGLKDSKQALGAEVLAGMQALAPPTIFAQASRLNFSTRLFNLLVTNVPGPQFPLYLLGGQLQDLFPIAFLPKRHALAIAIMSYDGGMDFGLLGDYDAMPDLERLGEMLDESLDELLAAADAAAGTPERNGKSSRASSRARTSRPRTSSRATTEG